ncbi:tetratricopeptide repeat protein [Novipirellula artificiosorum]|uniref:Tol-pal system protein YbgF n=1 Tax=Novipirellula artificiosorum TaxID=2528016 RepID=A0A5C6E548_9BACT|nr:tetratricopeptide repeat protein [Novipirellula artificiosorum]TWU42711.1 tol-pal system protein YbgF [Novipirellula artificiosorum]
MPSARHSLFAFVAICGFVSLIGYEPVLGADALPAGGNDAASTCISSLPPTTPAIQDAMQSRAFDQACELIEAELAKEAVTDADHLRYLQGVALTEAKKYDEAIAAFERLEKDFPESDWISRSRFGRANVMVRQRQYIDAGVIYEAEAERLLSRDRKDELAKIYLEFADRYFEGLPAEDPSQAKQPDYAQALTYYSEAVKLGPTLAVRQQIEFRIARCQEELKQNAEADKSYQRFLDQYAEGESAGTEEMLVEVQFRLGSVQLGQGLNAAARRTWQDLLLEGKHKTTESATDAIQEFVARAEYEIAHTYGLPKTPTVGDLELAVAAAAKFLQNHPTHELAPKAEYEIAGGYFHHGRHQQAIEWLKKLIDNPAYQSSDQVPIARQALGNQFLAQEKFDQAISAWKAFLDKHPTDPKWPEVQKRIVDAEYAKGEYAAKQKQYDAARETWQTFLNKYPLDPRAASILLQFGKMKYDAGDAEHTEKVSAAVEAGQSAQSVELSEVSASLFETAIVDWRRVVSKYPKTSEASEASWLIGTTLEDQLGKLPEALKAYKETEGAFAAQAHSRITRLTTPQLQLVTERKFRSDEKPRIKLTTRNLEKVSVKAYRVDMTDYFRKMHLATGLEKLDIALIDPDQQFEHSIDGFAEYKQIDGDVEIAIDGPGVTAVTVSSEKLEATTMVVVSDIDMIVKSSRNELFLFAENMLEGKPAAGVSVLISDGSKVFAEEITGDDGVLQKNYDELKTVQDLRVFAVHQGHVASTVNNLNGLDFAVGLTPRGYLYTDRPAYRAGQLVNIKGIVRWVDQDRFTFAVGETFKLDLYDSRGLLLQSEDVALNAFGAITSNLLLPETTAEGDCRVHLHRVSAGEDDAVGALSFSTSFKVTEYKLEPIEISVDLEKSVYFRGETVKGVIELKYYYGTPLVGESVHYRLGNDGELLTAKTDSNGKIEIEFETQRLSESQVLPLTVEYRDRSLSATQMVYIATRGFAVTASSRRDVYLVGESFETQFQVADPAGDPVETKLEVEVFKQTTTPTGQGEKWVESHQVTTDSAEGFARQTLALDDNGIYKIRATGTDQFGNQVSGEHQVRISGDKDAIRLRILAERHSFKVGELAELNLHWREQPALALVTFEGASILSHQLVDLAQGNNTLKVPMSVDFAPNVYLSVAVMQRNQFHAAESEFQVAQSLQVTLTPDQNELTPGGEVSVEIEVADPQGKPVSAELSLALVQTNLLQSFQESQTAIDEFFRSGRRTRAVRQATSCTFDDRPTTRKISQFLLAESERRETLERETQELAIVGDFAVSQYSRAPQAQMGGYGMGGGGFGGGFGGMAPPVPNAPASMEPQSAVTSGRIVYGGAVNADAGQAGQMQMGRQSGSNRAMPSSSKTWAANLSSELNESPQDQTSLVLSTTSLGLPQQSQVSINGITSAGKFVTVNGRGQAEAEQLARSQGLQVLPATAYGETAFWDPVVVTDEQGKATVTITLPERSTAWRLRAKGINHGTLAGEASADVVTKKDLFGELKLPLAFTAGDSVQVPVEIHHSLDDARKVTVKLKATLGDKSTEQTQAVDVEGPAIQKLVFPVEIEAADQAVFELSVSADDGRSDQTTAVVAIRPYGFPVYATASGTSSQSTLAMLAFNEKLKAEESSLEILIGANVNRSLVRSVLGSGDVVFPCGLISTSPMERAVSDVLGGVSLQKMMGEVMQGNSPDSQTLSNRITSAVTVLISAQRQDGGWAWSGKPNQGDADSYLSARVMWALSEARAGGFLVPSPSFDKGKSFLQSSFTSTPQSNLERQTVLLHAMAVSGCGDFAFANRLYRERNRLSSAGLTHLALTLAAMNRKEMAAGLIDLIKIPFDSQPIAPADRSRMLPWTRNRVELQAMVLLAIEEIVPNHPQGAKGVEALMAARIGDRWPVEKSNGPAIAALARWYSIKRPGLETYRLTVSVNDQEIETLEMDPAQDPGRRIRVSGRLLRSDKPNRIEFSLQGRATFCYSAVLTGFVAAGEIESTTKEWSVSRSYEPAKRMFDGHEVPRGFDVVNGSYKSFTNPLTQLPVGQLAEVTLKPRRYVASSQRDQPADYLVLTEPIPAGCVVLSESVSGTFERFEIGPGQITFYLGDRQYPGDIHYTVVGYVPGRYRTPQSVLRSFYEPAHFAVSTEKELQVLGSEGISADEYRWTPDELYSLGQQAFEKQHYALAHQHLTTLFSSWQLDADKYKHCVEWLFAASLAENMHNDIVAYFEVLKEKYPEVEISFEDILRVAKSYQTLGEYERSYLVYRATIEGSFERESQVAGFLNARGEFVRSVQAMEKLLRDYPRESYIASAAYALAQETFRRAGSANQDQKMKATGLTRVHLIRSSIKMLDHFVTTWPLDPEADQASFALATALVDLEQFPAVIQRCKAYADRYPSSRLLDSFWYMIGYAHFELEQAEQALEMCRKVAAATFPVPATGATRRADNRWEAIYIMGQIYHSLGDAAKAIAEYTQVEERFADAAEAIDFFNRKQVEFDEVTTIKTDNPKTVELRFRNIDEVALKVYRIDLMKFGLMQRNLNRITAINLAGIKPHHEETVQLGDGKDYRDRTKTLSLPLEKEGAYLIVGRGGNLYASGLVLVSPLTLMVQEDVRSGRVRVSIKDASDDRFVSDVHVKVIGSANDQFVSGDTDLRGLMIADDIQGTSTVIAQRGADHYAFYRGKLPMQRVQAEDDPPMGEPFGGGEDPFDDLFGGEPAAQQAAPRGAKGKGTLRDNLLRQNWIFQNEKQQLYEGLLNNERSGIKSKEAY